MSTSNGDLSFIPGTTPGVKYLVIARRGKIALVASLAAYSPLADAPAYSASKSGLLAYGLATREALRGQGVSITVACPGYVATPMGSVHLGQRPQEVSADEAARRIIEATLRGRATVGFPTPLHEMARLTWCRIDKLIKLGFFRDRPAAESYVSLLETLHQDPTRKDVAWLLGIDEDVMNEDIRLTEVRNWIDRLVIPAMATRH